MIEAVFYDFDGVLVNSERIHFQCWNTALEPEHVSLSSTEYASDYSGSSTGMIASGLVSSYQLGVKPKVLAARKERAFSAIVKKYGIPLIQGAKDSIKLLRAADIRLGIVTSSKYDDVKAVLKHGKVFSAF